MSVHLTIGEDIVCLSTWLSTSRSLGVSVCLSIVLSGGNVIIYVFMREHDPTRWSYTLEGVGCLSGWCLVSWLVGRSPCLYVSRSACLYVSRSVGLTVCQSVGQLVCMSVGQLVCVSVCRTVRMCLFKNKKQISDKPHLSAADVRTIISLIFSTSPLGVFLRWQFWYFIYQTTTQLNYEIKDSTASNLAAKVWQIGVLLSHVLYLSRTQE